MTREERFKIDMIAEFKQICKMVERNGVIIQYKSKMLKILEQEPCEDEYIKVPKKALKYRTAGMVAYNVEWLKNHFDMERVLICGAQEPKTDGDCISRQDLLKKCVYAPIAPVIKGDSVHYEDVVFARDIINAEPIQPKAKTGRWIDTGSKNFEFHKVYKCSKCGTTEIEYPESIYRHLRYCPNCGAKMEVSE